MEMSGPINGPVNPSLNVILTMVLCPYNHTNYLVIGQLTPLQINIYIYFMFSLYPDNQVFLRANTVGFEEAVTCVSTGDEMPAIHSYSEDSIGQVQPICSNKE